MWSWLFDGASSGESCLFLMLRAFPELLKDAAASHWPHRRNNSVPVLKWRSLRLQAFLPLITGLITRAAYCRDGSQTVGKSRLIFSRSILWNIRRLKICLIPRKWLFTLYFQIINRRPEQEPNYVYGIIMHKSHSKDMSAAVTPNTSRRKRAIFFGFVENCRYQRLFHLGAMGI